MKLDFGHYFATDAWLWLWSSILVEILKVGLLKIFKFKFCRNANVWLRFCAVAVGAWSRFWRCLIKICVRTCDTTKRSYFGKQNSTLGSAVPLAMFFYIAWQRWSCPFVVMSIFLNYSSYKSIQEFFLRDILFLTFPFCFLFSCFPASEASIASWEIDSRPWNENKCLFLKQKP